MQHGNGSVANFTAAGRTYPAKVVQTCHVCKSHVREAVERRLLAGDPPSLIAEAFSGSGLSPRNVADHWRNGHVPIDPAVRDMLATDAKDRGRALEEAALDKATHVRFAEAIVERVASALEAGTVEPTIRDAVAAASLLGRYAPPDDSMDDINQRYALVRVLGVLRKHVTPEQREKIAAEMRAAGVHRLLGIDRADGP